MANKETYPIPKPLSFAEKAEKEFDEFAASNSGDSVFRTLQPKLKIGTAKDCPVEGALSEKKYPVDVIYISVIAGLPDHIKPADAVLWDTIKEFVGSIYGREYIPGVDIMKLPGTRTVDGEKREFLAIPAFGDMSGLDDETREDITEMLARRDETYKMDLENWEEDKKNFDKANGKEEDDKEGKDEESEGK